MRHPKNALFLIFYHEVRRNKGLAGLLITGALVAVLAIFLVYSREEIRLVSRGVDPRHLARQWAINVSFIETTIFVLLSPFLGLMSQAAIGRGRSRDLFLLAPRASLFYVMRWFFSLSLVIVLLGISSCLYLYFVKMGLPVADVAASRLTLLSMTSALTALGFCAGILLREVSVSLVLSYLLVSLLVGQVLLAGPFLDQLADPGRMIYLLMVTNGYAGMASSFDLDIMRRGWLYDVSPVGMYRFDYPAWYAVAIFHAAMAAVFIMAGLRGHKRVLT